jgi:undecaprenyl-diphosphatase
MTTKSFISKILEKDKDLIIKYNGFGGKFFTLFLRTISFLGRETIWLLLISYYLFIWYDPYLISHLGSNFLLGLIIIVPLKEIIKRIRPFEDISKVKNLEYKPTSSSFPSWHVYNITSQGLLLGFLSESIVIIFIMIVAIVLVSFSRIQLGVHYPSDVIIGLLLGIIGFLFTIFFFAPLIIKVFDFFEVIIPTLIYFNQINPFLMKNGYYLILVVVIFGIIVLSSFYKIIWQQLKKE